MQWLFRKFRCDHLANDDSYGTSYYWQWMGSYILAFELYIYIWLWPNLKMKFKVRHISTINVLEMVTDRIKLLLPPISKSCIGFWLTYLHLTLAHSKDQGQSHIYNEYLRNGDKLVQLTIALNLQVMSKSYFDFQYFHLTVAHSKGQGQGYKDIYNEYFRNGDRQGNNYYCH